MKSKTVYNEGDQQEKYPKHHECFFQQHQLYPQLNIIKLHYNTLHQECMYLFQEHLKSWHTWIEGQLMVYPIYFLGKWSPSARTLCPKTCELLSAIPGIKTAEFSCLLPHSQIQPHKGWGDLANYILRCHYGIDVPQDCGCVCDNFVQQHKTREWVIFDDSKMHSSYNFSDYPRIILIVDMERPESIAPGICTVAYTPNLMSFIQSFYSVEDVVDIQSAMHSVQSKP